MTGARPATLRPLLLAKWRSLVNALQKTRGVGWRAAVVGVLGLAFWGGLFGASYWFLDQCQRVEIFGDVLVEQLLAMALLVIFAVLVFSNLVSSFSAYFLADDLDFLMARPLSPYAFYTARFVELMVQSSWMVGLFSLPVFLAMGLVYGVGPGFYVQLVALLLPLFVIATALATLVSLVLTNVLPARRTREVLLLLLALAFVGVFVLLRSLKPERFLNPDERQGMIEVLATFSAPRASVLPSEWVHRLLWPAVTDRPGGGELYLGCLFASAAGLFFVGAWVFRAMHFEGFSKAAEGRPEGSAPERLARRLLGRRSTAAERGQRHLTALARRTGPLGFARAMRQKDRRTFVRDTAQWTQLVLLAALVVIYLLNFKYIQAVGEGGFITPLGLYFCNLSLAAFVVTAICVRFVFPMVSLEGRAFWLVRSAPLSSRQFLFAKWRSAVAPIWAFGQLLTVTSNVMIGVDPTLWVIAAAIQTPAIVGVVGLGVGLGALYPKFDHDNAAKIATGFGGFSYMVTGVLVSLFVVVLSYWPTRVLLWWLEGDRRMPGATGIGVAVGMTVAAVALPLFVAWVTVRAGARRLEE